MKYKGIIFLLLQFLVNNIFGQCPGCITVPNCAAQNPIGGLCRGDLSGMVAHSYDRDITFYMPKSIDCAAIGRAGQCTTIELKQIKIASVTSPPGISNTGNKPIYNVSSGDTLGCIKFCGTPLVAGTHIVTVNLLANVTAHGTPGGDLDLSDQAFPYIDTIFIIEDTTKSAPLSTFSYKNKGIRSTISILKNCDSLDLDSLKANILGDCNLATYKWEIESKGNYAGKAPITGMLKFKTPDTFSIKLTTQLYNYRIKNVRIGNVTGGYLGGCGICMAGMEEIIGKPDLFITIDVAAYNNRRNCGQTSCGKHLDEDANILFDSLDLLIPGNKCNQTFRLGIYDEDSAPFGTVLTLPLSGFASADDLLDTYYVMPSLGIVNIPNGNFTNSVQVEFDTIPNGAAFSEILTYIIYPSMPTANISAAQDSACVGQNINVSVNNTNHFVEWYRDTAKLLGNNSNSILINSSGNYSATLTSSTGCITHSNIKKFTFLPYPDPLIYFKKDSIYIQNYNPIYFNYDWKIDTVSNLEYKNLSKIKFTKTGFYKVVAYNKYCTAESDALYYINHASIDNSLEESIHLLEVTNNELTLNSRRNMPIEISIYNSIGSKQFNLYLEQSDKSRIDISHLPAGLYFLNLEQNGIQINSFKFAK